jgi:hypothetical protein
MVKVKKRWGDSDRRLVTIGNRQADLSKIQVVLHVEPGNDW